MFKRVMLEFVKSVSNLFYQKDRNKLTKNHNLVANIDFQSGDFFPQSGRIVLSFFYDRLLLTF